MTAMGFLQRNLKALVCLAVMLGGAGAITTARADAVSDLVVGYGAAQAARFGSESALQAATLAQIATANNVAANSGSPHRQRVAGFIKSATDCDYLTTTGGMVGWLANYDGHVTDVLAYADSLGADLVTYIFKNSDSVAGVAQQPGRTSAYNDQMYWTYFAHESGGHNFGGNHGDAVINPTTVMGNNYCGGGAQGYYSNPNIWLSGVKLLGTGNCTGGTIYGGDSAYVISTAAQGKADSYERQVWGSNLFPIVRRWKFNQPAGAAVAGTVIADDISGSQAIVRGQGATFTGNGLKLPGGTTGNAAANSIAAYLDLPNGIFSSMPNFTIEIWATPISAKAWMRVIEIGRPTQAGDGLGGAGEYTGTPGSAAPGATEGSDVIGLSAVGSAGTLASQRMIAGLDGTYQVADSTLATTANEMHHYAITFANTTAGGTVKWFRDGALIKTLDVTFHSAALEDVNIWLGRSLWSGDQMANIEFHDVRIQSVALKDGQVVANYLIGPFDAKATLWANDAWGSSGFNSGSWEFGNVPSSARDYETGTMRLLTPYDSLNHTFPGKSLSVTGGNFYLVGKTSTTTTVNDLRLNGGSLIQLAEGGNGNTQTLAGTMTVAYGNTVRAEWGPIKIAAKIVGGYSMMYVGPKSVTLSGDNTGFDGWTTVGDGRFSTLVISSETNLGRNPPWFGGDWLTLNRGILATTQTMIIDDANRGIRIGPSGGFFNPWANTTLTIATPISSPAAGNTLQTAPMDSNPIAGIMFKDDWGQLILTNPNNSHNGEIQILKGEMMLSGNGRLNNGDHWMPFTINGLFTDNSALDQTVRGVISGNGAIVKGNSSTLNVNGANTFTGSVTVNGGTLYANPGNAATNRAFSYVSGISVNSGGTLRSGANGLFGWDGTQEKPIIVNAGGTLTADSNADVGVGTVTLAGGTLTNLGASAAWGSWRFDNATDKLAVTDNSTVSAVNVKFGNAGAAIDVAAGKTLNFTGTITNATSGGTSYLTKTGPGTLTLAAANTYTGATAINAGTLNLTGSLTGNSAVTVASGATLTGAGTISGNLSFVGNAIHSPGNPTGMQTVGGVLSYDAGSRVMFTLLSNSNATGAASGVAATGALTVTSGAVIDLTFNAAVSSVNFYDTFWTQARTWTVVGSNGMTGTFALGAVTNDSGNKSASSYGTFSLTQGSTGAILNWTPKSFTAWRGIKFGASASNAATSGFLANPDVDSLVNAWEYFHDTNPSSNSRNPVLAQTLGNRLSVTFPRNTAATDVVATVRGADDVGGPWIDLARSAGGAPFSLLNAGATVTETGTGSVRTVEVKDIYLTSDPAHPKRFLRLVINQQ